MEEEHVLRYVRKHAPISYRKTGPVQAADEISCSLSKILTWLSTNNRQIFELQTTRLREQLQGHQFVFFDGPLLTEPGPGESS